MAKVEVVQTVPACKAISRRLEREQFIAVDTEGVHLGKTGPITLVQVATARGQVYLFDVLQEPDMFHSGGLKRLLESESVIKVLHAAKNDGKALFYQHGVKLSRVHDTQLADMEVHRGEGRQFPQRRKLEDICEVYCPEKQHLLTEGKGALQTKWNKTEGAYWAKRPLTEEMTHYAANDVIAIVPEVYQEQTRELQEKRLLASFNTHVEQDLLRCRDETADGELRKQEKELMATILGIYAAQPGARHKKLEDIDDINVLDSVKMLSVQEMDKLNLPSFIKGLKLQDIDKKLDELEQELDDKGDTYEYNRIASGHLQRIIRDLEDGETKTRAKSIDNRINDIVFKDLETKYRDDTPACYIDENEKTLLRTRLRRCVEDDPNIHPTHLSLHWTITLEDLDTEIAKFQKDKKRYKPKEKLVKDLRFYTSAPVPADVKQKGKQFLWDLQDDGKVEYPPKKRSNDRPRHHRR